MLRETLCSFLALTVCALIAAGFDGVRRVRAFDRLEEQRVRVRRGR